MTTQATGIWCNKHEAAKITGLSTSTLKNLRLSDELIEGIHWVRLSSRSIRYNAELLKDWMATRLDTVSHEQAISNYLNSLPSRQPQTGDRRARKLAG
jgi:hypothetical protein